MNRLTYITKTVWVLSLVSLFTDTASEMLYPVMPVYLKSIGFSVIYIGLLEGIAEATAGLSKGYFGKRSDQSGRRAPFVQAGYALSALSKPLLGLFTAPVWIFGARTLDRLGKGIRTGARDAILSDQALEGNKGRIFGFHRSMDTLGAVLGPSLALVYLYFFPGRYRQLFFIAFLPGVLAVLASLLIKDSRGPLTKAPGTAGFFSFLAYLQSSPPAYRRLLIGLLAFALVNSSDVFLLLRARQSGLSDLMVIEIYIFYNIIYALSSFPLGILGDRAGLRTVFLLGLSLFALVYAAMTLVHGLTGFAVLFLLYGIYAGATDGISKAWISRISAPKEMATAIGTYTAFQSIAALLASFFTGLIWYRFGSGAALMMSACLTLLVIVYFLADPSFQADRRAR